MVKTHKKRKGNTAFEGFRRKFVVTNMAFVLVVLVAVLSAVGVANYSQRVSEVYDSLQHRVSIDVAQSKAGNSAGGTTNWGSVPPASTTPLSGSDESISAGNAGEGTPSEANAANSSEAGSGQSEQAPNAAEGDASQQPSGDGIDGAQIGRDGMGSQMVATSSFSIDAESGEITAISDTLSMNADALASAVSVAQGVIDASGESMAQGHADGLGYYYRIEKTESGYMLAFASDTYVSQGTLSLLGPFLLAGLGALAAFFVVSVLLSNWAVRPVERAWRQQQQFIADASHELKTPLTVIIANDSILASQPNATVASQMQWIESTETEARLMQGLVNDMLYLAQMEDGEREHVLSRLDFSDVVQNVALQFESVAFERGVLIESSIAPGVEVNGDQMRLMRMVATLVDNACKYAESNGSVRVALEKRSQVCRLSVHNSGNPISPDDLPHLFDRFYRADKARTSGKGGYGLGLSIAKSIAEEHGGTIRVASSAAEGTTFTVELPLA